MTWEEQLQNCVTNDTSASGRILHLTPYMDELIKSTHSMALQKQFIPPPPRSVIFSLQTIISVKINTLLFRILFIDTKIRPL